VATGQVAGDAMSQGELSRKYGTGRREKGPFNQSVAPGQIHLAMFFVG